MPTAGIVHRCTSCGHIISKRKITIYFGILKTLKDVKEWCEKNDVHEFTRKQIKHLFKNENDTARFGDLVMFGGLVYKKEKAVYGINTQRCNDFFSGRYKIPTVIWKDPISKELYLEDYKFISEIPKLIDLLDDKYQFISEYSP